MATFAEVAEGHALDELRRRGFRAALTRSGADGGLDVVSIPEGLGAQVKATTSPVGAPTVQQLAGAGRQQGLHLLAFFSIGGYSRQALSTAAATNIALFEMDLKGGVRPVNSIAESFGTVAGLPNADLLADPTDPLGSGDLMEERGDLQQAMFWWRQGAETGDHRCMDRLGVALYQAGSDEAEHWLREACERNPPGPAFLLGCLYFDRGECERALLTWNRGAMFGNSSCMGHLGDMERDAGDLTSSESWYRKAIAAGSSIAMRYLAVLLLEQERTDEAVRWLRQGAASGDDGCMQELGKLHEGWGDNAAAEEWFRQGALLGNLPCMWNLGAALDSRREWREAEEWFRRSAESENDHAWARLATFLTSRGRFDEAEPWYLKAVQAGSTLAMWQLAHQYSVRFRKDEAEALYRRGGELGDEDCMFDLGRLLDELGRIDEAEYWLRTSIEHGAEAENELRDLLARTGRSDEAESWHRKGADAGDEFAVGSLGDLLAARSEFYSRLEENESPLDPGTTSP